MNKLAQIKLSPDGGFKGFGPLGLEGQTAYAGGGLLTDFISSAIGIISVIAIIWFVFVLITGAFSFMTAGSDKAAIEAAQKKILNGVIGLAVTVFGVFVIKLIGTVIGLPDILNLNFFLGELSK